MMKRGAKAGHVKEWFVPILPTFAGSLSISFVRPWHASPHFKMLAGGVAVLLKYN